MRKYRGLVFAAGALLALLGLIVMAASLGSSDSSGRMVGGIFFSFGCVTVAAMFYLQARELRTRHDAIVPPAQHPRERCFACGTAKARMRCLEHNVRLCFACIESHHSPACRYVPAGQARAPVERPSVSARDQVLSRS